MFKNLTYKKKFYAVLIISLLLIFAVYKKTYKNIISVNGQLNELNSKAKLSENAVFDIHNLKEEIKTLDHIIGGNNINPEHVQQELLTFISNQGINVELIEILDIHKAEEGEFNIYTNQIVLEGDYKPLVSILFEIEKSFNKSKLVNTSLYTIKNYNNNRKKLYLKIIFQNYEKNN